MSAVLIIGNYPPPFGGVPRHIQDLVPGLVGSGWRVHVVSGGLPIEDERREGFTLHRFGSRQRKILLLRHGPWALRAWRRRLSSFRGLTDARPLYGYLSIAAACRDIVRRHAIDVISAYNLMTYGPIGAIVAEDRGVPLVVHSFGEYFKYPEFFRRHVDLASFTVRRATIRLSMTEHCAAAYRALAPELDCEIVPYGVDLTRFAPDGGGRAVRDEFGIPGGAPVVLYFARFASEMGLGVLLAALPEILSASPSMRVILAGKPEDLAQEAIETAKRFPGRVFVCPNVSDADQPAYYAAATVVVVPSLDARACGSLSAAEAAAAGRAVVASRIGGVPEFVRDGETGWLVPPGDASRLAEALTRSCRDHSEASARGAAARRFAVDHLDVARTNARLASILAAVAGRRCAAGST